MPKRSNEFQKVVYLLQRQLGEAAIVEESKMLRNQATGQDNEVDIVVESSVGGHPITVGIECTAQKRPASIEWVQHMYGKHQSLPIDLTVLVSKAGYSSSALQLAEAHQIRALTLEVAETTSWPEIFEAEQNWELGAFQFSAKNAKFHYQPPIPSAQAINGDCPVWRGKPDDPITTAELIKIIVSDRNLGIKSMKAWLAMEKEQRPTDFDFSATWIPAEECKIEAHDGNEYQILKIDLEVHAIVSTAKLPLSQGSYSGAAVAFGAAENIFEQSGDKAQPVIVAMSRTLEGQKSGHLFIPKFEGGDDQVFTMQFNGEADIP